MEQEAFQSFAEELGARFKGTGERWMVIVWKPGGDETPHSAGNMETAAQILLLRSIAESLEENEQLIFRRHL